MAEEDLDVVGRHEPAALGVDELERLGGDVDGDAPRFARFEADAPESLQLDERGLHAGLRVADVQLDDLVARAVADVRDGRGDGHAPLLREGIREAGIGIRELGIAEAEPEREEDSWDVQPDLGF